MAGISLSRVCKRFGTVEVIRQVSLDIEPGELVVFLGPSGSGKTTLLRMIAGLESIDEGTLTIDGVRSESLHPGKRNVAMVFQNYALYPHMTVAQNMAFGLKRSHGASRKRLAFSKWRRCLTAGPRSFPADSGSGWPSVAPSSRSRRRSFSTSPCPILTPRFGRARGWSWPSFTKD